MKIQFNVGHPYSTKEIEENGFIKTKVTYFIMFYKKDNMILAFNNPMPLEAKLYRLIDISYD